MEQETLYDTLTGRYGEILETHAMADEFVETFKDLLEIAKPLI